MTGAAPSPPTFTLFGVPTLTRGGDRVVFTTERPFQLLAYLACRRRWVRRDELADVLYPERDAAQARSNLRKVLLLADRVPGVQVERQGDVLRWSPRSDVEAFEAAVEERRLQEAIAVGAATLLEGFDDAFLGDGRAWLLAERQRLATLWKSACMQRLAELAVRPAEAATLARTLLKRDPLDEAGVQALARAHLSLGESDAAQVAIAAYARQLADQLGLEPTAAIRDLAQAARGAAKPPPSSALPSAGVATSVPVDAFIGRRVELKRMVERLRRPDCRLLTLVGPGGVGKTSLARRLCHRVVPDTVESIAFVPLADLTDAGQVPARIAAAIGATLSGDAEPWAAVGAALGERSIALVLDNAEPFELAARLERLLVAVPRLKLVVTSRARLGGASEQVLPIEGLPLPDLDETDVEVLRCCDAVALFEARAMAAASSFDLRAHAVDVVRLVHRVEGLPLAIELAATWTRLLPVAEIADEISRSIDLLEGDSGSSRGLRASFGQSWRLLGDAERACLPRLASLTGDFGRDLALHVGGASLPVLAALVDKSLLRADGSGRFSMHALLRRCAAERAEAGDDPRALLTAFIARWLGDYASSHVTIPGAVMDEIERELAHVRAAWRWATGQRDAAALAAMARALSLFFERRGMIVEGLSSFAGAVLTIDEDADVATTRARAVVLRGLMSLQYRAGAFEKAEASAHAVVALARAPQDNDLLMAAFAAIGNSLWARGRFQEARAPFERALALATEGGVLRGIGIFSGSIALIEQSLGRYEQAVAAYERVLAIERAGDNVESLALTLNNAANPLRALGRVSEALHLLNEALVLCAQHGLHALRPSVMLNFGLNHLDSGDGAAARSWFEKALAEPLLQGTRDETTAVLSLAQLDAESGDPAVARGRAWQALTLANRLQQEPVRVDCVAVFGEILIAEGRVGEGLGLMRWAVGQPAFEPLDRDVRERRLDGVSQRLGSRASPRELSLEMTVSDVLALVAVDDR